VIVSCSEPFQDLQIVNVFWGSAVLHAIVPAVLSVLLDGMQFLERWLALIVLQYLEITV
jgi:hypothetical protein